MHVVGLHTALSLFFVKPISTGNVRDFTSITVNSEIIIGLLIVYNFGFLCGSFMSLKTVVCVALTL